MNNITTSSETPKKPTVSTINEFYKIRENLSLKCGKMTASELKMFLKSTSEKVLKELEK